MFSLIARLFIKDYKNISNPSVRTSYGVVSGALGIFFNFVLFALKLFAGVISCSISVIADAFNNLSDAAASIVTIIGFKLSSKKPDKEHPFGHGRMEYIAALLVSILILLMGFELLKESANSIFHPKALDASVFTIVVLLGSIAVKFYMFFYNSRLAKKLVSGTMKATAQDSLNDCISTGIVLAVTIVLKVFPQIKIPLDGCAGVIVALFILWGGYESVKETISPLLGVKPDPDFVSQVEKVVMSYKPVCGIHDLIVHDYGPGRLMVTLHAEVPGEADIFELHEVIDRIEGDLSNRFGAHVTIHMDPVDTNNKEIPVLKAYISNELKTVGEGITIHDLRMVPGQSHTNVIFDVVRPYDCSFTEDELKDFLRLKICEYNKTYNAVVCVDQEFV